jgi:lipopolysaccharide export system ATP-binding protein
VTARAGESWIDSAASRDPSTPVALAALLQAADDRGIASFAALLEAYRETFVRAHQSPDGAGATQLSGDEIRDHLRGSLLPRLALEGWVRDTAVTGWEPVVATGEWWDAAHGARATTLEALLDAARRPAREVAPPAASLAAPSVLRGTGLAKAYRGRRVVDDVTIELRQGEIVALLGPNGAGKTTTFYLITGLIRPDAGRVTLDSRDLTRAPMYRRARAGIGYLAQEPSVFRRMTVEENVMAILETRKLAREERQRTLERMLDELAIKHLRRSRAYSLSGGERRRLEITRALVSEPKFMLLDEPFAGVDPIAVHDIQTIVAGLRHRGIGVLITDHNVEQTLDIVDRAYIMFEGRVQAAGPVRDLVMDDRVAQLYLGPTLTARLRARLEAVA